MKKNSWTGFLGSVLKIRAIPSSLFRRGPCSFSYPLNGFFMKNEQAVLVLGSGRSGQAAKRLLCHEGETVLMLSEETHSFQDLTTLLESQPFSECIISPGFALEHPWVEAIAAAGVLLRSELELGWSRHKGKTIAVTGSNGKSTAVKLICETLKRAGLAAEIGGNYGVPASEVISDHPNLDWFVLEVSSFQLETIHEFAPDISLILNILPNHLNRHETMENYQKIKARIFEVDPLSKAVQIIPHDLLPQFESDFPAKKSKFVTFGEISEATYYFENGCVLSKAGSVVDLSGTLFDHPILGGCTSSAVTAIVDACDVDLSYLESAAKGFAPLPHRFEVLGKSAGVQYVNDSKATNLSAMVAAIKGCDADIHLIAGGLCKETDLIFFKEVLAERVRKIYLIGQSSQDMYKAWNEACLCVECETLEKAFNLAGNIASEGDTILLSPGCASFDQFGSFEERGECFTALFQSLAKNERD